MEADKQNVNDSELGDNVIASLCEVAAMEEQINIAIATCC
jgi:hypothetical protein